MNVSAQAPFRPWVAQRRKGFALTATGVVGLVAPLYVTSAWTLPCAAAGCAALLVGLTWIKRAKARAHGQDVEAKHLPLAVRYLEAAGFLTERNVRIGRSDVDLVVRHLGHLVTIEVKSFGYWRSRFQDRPRERKVRDQALYQQRRLGALAAVIWLPNARHTWLSRVLDFFMPDREVVVVRGAARRLVPRLKSVLKA